MTDVEYTDEFEEWWGSLNEAEQIDVAAVVGLLEELGTRLGFPYTSSIEGSKNSSLRELRIQHKGKPYRIFYIFDPRRVAILLIGGMKAGQDEKLWYKKQIRIAERLYSEHLMTLEKEGLLE